MYSSSQTSSEEVNVRIIDCRSDTISQPTAEMRQAMFEAKVGDDVYGEDPTVTALELRSAEIFQKEAGLFIPSGTMGNLIAIMNHCNRRGTEAVVGDMSHTFLYEQGGAASIGGVQLSTIKNNVDGTFCLTELRRKIRGFDQHEPITKLVVVENTHNMCGGKVIPLEWLDRLSKICTENNLFLHMDGARVFNAAAYLKVPVSRITRDFDSVCFCLSKGLSCPLGSVLVGTKAFIDGARRLRKALGGGMRQGGVVAVAGLVAFDTIVPILDQDHKHLILIAEAIHKLNSPQFKVDIENVQTNILLVQLVNTKLTSTDFANRLATIAKEEFGEKLTDADGKGIIVKVSSRDWAFVRIVLYHQITSHDIELVIKKITFVIKELDSTV